METQTTSSHIDDLMNDMGMSSDPEVTTTDSDIKVDNDTADKQEDLSVSNETTVPDTNDGETEAKDGNDSLQSQIDGMEKRLRDKDDFINELREQVKAKEAKVEDDTEDVEDEGFWDKPEETIKSMQEQIRMQNLQYQEVIFANGVDDYFKTVNGADLKDAVSTDAEFAEKFNNSPEPYKVAYEYLTQRNTKIKESSDSARAKMKAELMEEIKAEGGSTRTAPAGINNTGSSNRSVNADAPEDGFASVFNS